MPEKAYEKLYEQQGGGYMLLVRVKDQADLKGLIADFKKNTDVNIEAISMDAKAMEITIDDMNHHGGYHYFRGTVCILVFDGDCRCDSNEIQDFQSY